MKGTDIAYGKKKRKSGSRSRPGRPEWQNEEVVRCLPLDPIVAGGRFRSFGAPFKIGKTLGVGTALVQGVVRPFEASATV